MSTVDALDALVPPGASAIEACVLQHEERIAALELVLAKRQALEDEEMRARLALTVECSPLCSITHSNVTALRDAWRVAKEDAVRKEEQRSGASDIQASIKAEAASIASHIIESTRSIMYVDIKHRQTIEVLEGNGFVVESQNCMAQASYAYYECKFGKPYSITL